MLRALVLRVEWPHDAAGETCRNRGQPDSTASRRPPTRHARQVPQGHRRAAGGAARAARHPHRARPPLAPPAPLRRRLHRHAARPAPRSDRRSPASAGWWRRASFRPGAGSGSSTRCCATTAASSSASGPARPFSTAPSRSARRSWSPARFASITAASWRRASSSCSPTRDGERSARGRTGAAGVSRHRGAEPQDHPLADRPSSRRAHRALRRRSCPDGAPRSARPRCRCPRRSARYTGPPLAEEAEAGRRRLAFDELLDLQLMLIRARTVAKRQRSGVAFEVRRDLTTRLRRALPWELTAGPAARAPRDHRRHDRARSDAPAPHGRRGDRQDRRRAVRHAARGGERLPGRPHGADRAPGRAARGHPRPACWSRSSSGPSCCWAGSRPARRRRSAHGSRTGAAPSGGRARTR